jgi:ribosomal peptide maturation radical SAM protein 1
LNGDHIAFRQKSPDRILAELKHLADRYGIRRFCAADNILDPRYFQTLLPKLKASKLDVSFVFEMRTSLARDQAMLLCESGLMAAQLGVESLSTPLLRLMNKGVTAMQNLQALKWFSDAGIEVKWNLLYGFPGEEPSEYAAMTDLLPSLQHLCPPQAVGRVRVDRFSPYFERPKQFGIANVRPQKAFHYVYPFPTDVLARLAYYFEYDFADGRTSLDYTRPFVQAVRTWQETAGVGSLRALDRPDGVLVITDTRPLTPETASRSVEFPVQLQQYRLQSVERAVYSFCDIGRTLSEIMDHLKTLFPSEPVEASRLQPILDHWIASRIAVHADDRYLSLALQVR